VTADTRLNELRSQVKRKARFIGRKPDSHNIVGLTLAEIAQTFGRAKVNKAVRDFTLKAKGFNEEPEGEQMAIDIKKFIESSTQPAPDGIIPIVRLFRHFYRSLTAVEQQKWTRSRFLVALTQAGYTPLLDSKLQSVIVGRRCLDKCLVVTDGIVAIRPLPPILRPASANLLRSWRAVIGRDAEGNVQRRFVSLAEAKRTGFSREAIEKAIHAGQPYQKLHWSYVSADTTEPESLTP